MENLEEVKKKSKRKESRYGKRYGFEFKLRNVNHVEWVVKIILRGYSPVVLRQK